VSWSYYFSNLPVIALWGTRHIQGTRSVANFYADAEAGRLPQVSFIDPWFVTPEGLANDDHPHADIRLGQQFISDVVRAFIESPQWESGALFITYDEWGGFWDHVAPPQVNDPRRKQGFGQLGFRVPTMLVSPYSRGGHTDHGVYDHTSILKFIETNWALKPLAKLHRGARDAGARDIGNAFDFTHFDPEVDVAKLAYTAPAEARVPCELRGHTMTANDLWALAESGWLESRGFRLDHRFEDSFRESFV
jgi:phospholipase C